MKKPNRQQFLRYTGMMAAAAFVNRLPGSEVLASHKKSFRVRLLRHATLVVEVGGKTILVDPMLSKKGAMDPIQNAANDYRIPMVDLPVSDTALAQLLAELDAVIVTHTHRDHWHSAASGLIAKDKIIICQPSDETKLAEQGFTHVTAVKDSWQLDDITFYRTNGQHGTGEIGQKMGTVSGFVIEYDQERIYIAGDTIWCQDVEKAITKYQPSHIIVNGGGARFLQGDAITMTTGDVISLSRFTDAKITVVHLETINHCLQARKDFRDIVAKNDLAKRVQIPGDGQWIEV